MYRDYVNAQSASLGRPMELLWFGKFGRPVIVFPTDHGRFYENEDCGLVASVQDRIDAGELQLVLVDSVNDESWYNQDVHPIVRAARHGQYDTYLRQELIPYVFERARRGDLAVYGAGLGAYHAANLAARYPDLVSRAVCFSGLYDVRTFTDGHWDETCYFHSPMDYIANMDANWCGKLSRVEWVIAAGEHDPLAHNAREFSGLLWAKGIPNHLAIWSGETGHDWRAWCDHFGEAVPATRGPR